MNFQMSRRLLTLLIGLIGLGLSGQQCPPPNPLTIEIVAPVADSVTCSDSLAVEVIFSRAVDPAVATITALLVEGIDSTPVQTDISPLFTVAATDATATLALTSEGRIFLSLNVDENGDGQAEDFRTATFERISAVAPPSVASISPTSGSEGTLVTIAGVGFCPSSVETSVRFATSSHRFAQSLRPGSLLKFPPSRQDQSA